MAGKKGRSGTNKHKDKPWADALRLAVHRQSEDGRARLMMIAEACVKSAMNGDMAAIKEIGDRLDGKPALESTVTVTRCVAAELPDDELADIATGGGDGAAETPVDPSQLN